MEGDEHNREIARIKRKLDTLELRLSRLAVEMKARRHKGDFDELYSAHERTKEQVIALRARLNERLDAAEKIRPIKKTKRRGPKK